MTELSPCPCCRGTKIKGGHHKTDPVYCMTCHLRGIDAGAWNTRPAPSPADVEAVAILSGLSSYLGVGLGDGSTTPEQFDARIRWGIEQAIALEIQRCADVVEECSKQPRTTWGEVKSRIQARAAIAAMSARPDDERAAVVEWLNSKEAQDEVINLTMAMRNADIRAAMHKCAEIIERGDHRRKV